MTKLCGRDAACARIDHLLQQGQGGPSATLVLRGGAGLGKTALLDYAAGRSQRHRVVRAVGVEAERELPFAALHQLFASLLDGLEGLPRPQAEALATAFGLNSGPAPDRLLVGVAVLSLLSNAAGAQPLLCVVDDAQWLDRSSAQVLAFVARRLVAEPVIMLFAARTTNEPDELAGLAEWRLEPLSDADARALFASADTGPLDARVRDRMIAEARGYPAALLGFGRRPLAANLAGGYAVPAPSALPHAIDPACRQRMEELPSETQCFLLVAAAEPTGDPTLLSRAAATLGIPPTAAAPAEAAGVITLGTPITFGHVLLRSVVYHGASREARSDAHRALAGATDPEIDPAGQAWHRGQATFAPDEGIATQLERSAGRAEQRGGLVAAAAFLGEAARLTSDPARRAQRALAAAQAEHLAGAPDAALALLAWARSRPLDELHRAKVELVDAQIALAARPSSDAPTRLFRAAKQLEPLDVGLARQTYLDAFAAGLVNGRLSGGVSLGEIASAVRRASPASTPPGVPDLMLEGLARLVTDGYEPATPMLQEALHTYCSRDLATGEGLRWSWLAAIVAMVLWDDEAWHALTNRNVKLVSDAFGGVVDTAWQDYESASLFNGLGRYAEACAAAERVCEYDHIALSGWGLAELVEAAARSSQPEIAAAALRQLEQRTGACGTDWALGIVARSRALLSKDDIAEELFAEAIDRLGRTRLRPELARARLLYGEWLRRQNRRLDAREELRAAHELFTSAGISEFADRARRELVATGETVRSRSVETRYDLTAQEAEIARLASDGSTNPEIAAQLFLSARTVEWHLRKVYTKLGISSRKELGRALEAGPLAVQAA